MTWFCRLSLRHTGCILGIVPGKDYPTGFPVRSHHLEGPEGHSQRLTANSIATTIDLITRCGGEDVNSKYA